MNKYLGSLLALGLALGAALDLSAAKREVNLFGWSEYIPQAVLDTFKAETGITVNYETYASNEEMLSKLLGGAAEFDLVQPSEYVVEALIAMTGGLDSTLARHAEGQQHTLGAYDRPWR